MITKQVLNELEKQYDSLKEINIKDLSLGGYYTFLKLNNDQEGMAINFFNVHGPHAKKINHRMVEKRLLRKFSQDPGFFIQLLKNEKLNYMAQSIKIASLNALSAPYMKNSFLKKKGLEKRKGLPDPKRYVGKRDVVGMIGCTGNYCCPEIGKTKASRIYFSDFEYQGKYKKRIEEYVKKNFQDKNVEISDGSKNKEICQQSDVLFITSGTLCTKTLDQLLGFAQDTRDIILVGYSCNMIPFPLFKKDISVITLREIRSRDFTKKARSIIRNRGPGFTNSIKKNLQVMHIVEK